VKKILFLVSITIFLVACKSTPPRKAMNLSLNTNNNPIKTFIVFSQEEINVDVPVQDNSGAHVQLGLVGAIIGGALDASVNNDNAMEAEKKLGLIRNGLLDFKFDQDIEKKADNTFSQIEGLNLLPFKSVRNEGLVASKLALGEAFFYISFSYKLTTDYRAPTITARARMALKGQNPKDDVVLYSNDFHFTGDLLKLSPEKYEKQKKYPRWLVESYAYMWATSHNEQLSVELEAGVSELFSLMLQDMKDPASTRYYSDRAGTATKYGFNEKDRFTSFSLTDTRAVIRSANYLTNGALCTFSAGVKKKEEQYCIF
jgi:hypothetical protein